MTEDDSSRVARIRNAGIWHIPGCATLLGDVITSVLPSRLLRCWSWPQSWQWSALGFPTTACGY